MKSSFVILHVTRKSPRPSPETSPIVGRPQIFNQLCIACHALGGQGGAVGPALDGVGARRDPGYLQQWLLDPHAMKADARMPKLPLTPGQVDELVAFLSHLKTGGTP